MRLSRASADRTHRRRPGVRAHVVVAVTTALLCGCSGLGNKETPTTEQNPTSAPEAADKKLVVPPAFAPEKGWESNEHNRVYAIAPNSGLFIDVYALSDAKTEGTPSPSPAPSASGEPAKNGTVVIARNTGDGTVAWSSGALRPLSAMATPQVRVVSTTQGEVAIVVRAGTVPADGIARARNVVVVDSFSLAARGQGAQPIQHLEREIQGSTADLRVAVGDGGVLFPAVYDERGKAVREAAVWHPLTGVVTEVPAGPESRRPCSTEQEGCLVRDRPSVATASGVLTTESTQTSAPRFTLMGSWSSVDIKPQDRSSGKVLGVFRNTLLVLWAGDGAKSPLYAVHDLRTGKALASGECAADADSGDDPGKTEADVAISPQGRYVAVDSVVLDVSAGTATCYRGDQNTRGVTFVSVGDNGIAYGTLLDDDNDKTDSVTVRLATKLVEPLPAGTVVPLSVLGSGHGEFVRSNPDGADGVTVAILPPK